MEQHEQRDLIIAYKNTFAEGSPGIEVLRDLCNTFHVFCPHDGSPYKEGQRSVVVGILNRVNINLMKYDELLKGEEAE